MPGVIWNRAWVFCSGSGELEFVLPGGFNFILFWSFKISICSYMVMNIYFYYHLFYMFLNVCIHFGSANIYLLGPSDYLC